MWQSRPVFISSTFADMQAERDYLRTRVFPELEERLAARRHNLEWVDLRVGVATASERDGRVRELHVLKVCLNEVRRCRPFLIVLLGDRYGWVPPEERIKAAAEEAREGFSAEVAGRSVTDLEIDFGVLSDLEQRPRSFFYFRESLPYAQMPADLAALYSEDYAADDAHVDRKDRLAALKRRIAEQLPTRVRRYAVTWDRERGRVAGLDGFGRMVLDDIWSELEAETRTSATTADMPWPEAEREALEDFIDDRARDFVGRQGVLDSLTNLVRTAGARCGVCVTGDSGSGKSALFGALHRRLQGSDVFLLAHSASASINAAAVDSMLRRWIAELADALGTDPGLADNADPESIDATFARLLGRLAQQRRVVILVDALDQFERTARGRHVTWLPRVWPDNARFIATAIPGNASSALAERQDLEVLPLPALDAAEAREIVVGICRRYHRTFEPEVVEALLAKSGPDGSAWGNPLWLVLAVEDLNLLDADDFARVQRDYEGDPAERLRALMIDTVMGYPADIPGLYAHTFARAEVLFGASLAGGFLGLIAISRAGWRETDFRILLPRASGENWDDLQFAQLRRLFRGQLRQRGALAQWDFSHAQMRAAVRSRLAAWVVAEQRLHAMIADRLLSCPPDDPLHISETMVHLLASEDYPRAAQYFGEASLSDAEIQGAMRVLADAVTTPERCTSAAAAQGICRLLAVDRAPNSTVAERFLFGLTAAVEFTAPVDSRLVLCASTRQAFERLCHADPANTRWRRNFAISSEKVGDVRLIQGDVAEALKSFSESTAVFGALSNAEPENVELQRDLSLSYFRLGDLQVAAGNLDQALKAYRDCLAINDRWARFAPSDLNWQRNAARAYVKAGRLQAAKGDLAGALQTYLNGLAVADRLTELEPNNAHIQHDLASARAGLGDLYGKRGDIGDALRCFRDNLALFERLSVREPDSLLWQDGLVVANNSIGNVQMQSGDYTGALKSYRETVAVALRGARFDPTNHRWQRVLAVARSNVGDAQAAQDDLAGALKSYCESLAALDRLAKSEPGNTGWQFDLANAYSRVGNLQARQGKDSDAIASHWRCFGIIDPLARSDLGNVSWQRELIGACIRIADVDPSRAKLMLARAADIAASLQERNILPPGDSWLPGELAKRIASLDQPAGTARPSGQTVKPEPVKGAPEPTASAAPELPSRGRQAASENSDRQREIALSRANFGDTQMAQGDLAGALNSYRAAHAIFNRLLLDASDDPYCQINLSVSLMKIGDAEATQGDLAGTMKSYLESLAVAERLVRSDRNDTRWHRHVAVMFGKIGRVQMASRDVAGARQSYDNSLAVYAELARSDPQNPDYQRELSLSFGKTGDVRLAQGDRIGALESYRNYLATADRAAKLEPDRGDSQRDVIVACIKIADLDQAQAQAVLMRASEVANSMQARGQLAPADSWMPADIAARLDALGRSESGAGGSDSVSGSTASSAPPTSPKEAQRARALSHGDWGDRQATQGDLAGALNSYRAADAILRNLLQDSVDDPHCQHDLSVSSWKIGDVYMAHGDFERAQAAYHIGLGLAEQVAKSDSNNAEWQRSLSVSLNKVGDAQRAQGNMANAFKYYHDGLSIIARLAQFDPTDTQLQYDLGISNERVGNVLLERGDLAGALQWYKVRQNIISRLAQSDQNNAAWQRDLVVSYVKCAWADPPQARTWLTRAAELASSMRARGILAPSDRGIPDDIARQISELP